MAGTNAYKKGERSKDSKVRRETEAKIDRVRVSRGKRIFPMREKKMVLNEEIRFDRTFGFAVERKVRR